MLSRRLMIGLAAMAAVPAFGQQGAGFVGTWTGDVPGVGATKLVIQQVKPDGQIEGRMEFELRSYVSTFADKSDSTANTNRGAVDGSKLTIEAALGGVYELELQSNALSGTYTRGTTYKVAVRLTRN
jgi:hypothetical protein